MKRNTVQIITYGTLMTGERNHRFCRNAVSIQPCTITGTIYDTGWGFPAFRPEGARPPALRLPLPRRPWWAG